MLSKREKHNCVVVQKFIIILKGLFSTSKFQSFKSDFWVGNFLLFLPQYITGSLNLMMNEDYQVTCMEIKSLLKIDSTAV